MNKIKIIKSVKRQEESKVELTFELPYSLKIELEELANSELISLDVLITTTLQSLMENNCEIKLELAQKLMHDLNNKISNFVLNNCNDNESMDKHIGCLLEKGSELEKLLKKL